MRTAHLFLPLVILLSGCGMSASERAALVAEETDLKTQYESLKWIGPGPEPSLEDTSIHMSGFTSVNTPEEKAYRAKVLAQEAEAEEKAKPIREAEHASWLRHKQEFDAAQAKRAARIAELKRLLGEAQ